MTNSKKGRLIRKMDIQTNKKDNLVRVMDVRSLPIIPLQISREINDRCLNFVHLFKVFFLKI